MKVKKIKMDALNLGLTKLGVEMETVRIYTNNESRRDTYTVYGVNWAGTGTQAPEDAVKFAEKIQTAAKIAETLNRCEIEQMWAEDDREYTKEEFIAEGEKALEALKRTAESSFINGVALIEWLNAEVA